MDGMLVSGRQLAKTSETLVLLQGAIKGPVGRRQSALGLPGPVGLAPRQFGELRSNATARLVALGQRAPWAGCGAGLVKMMWVHGAQMLGMLFYRNVELAWMDGRMCLPMMVIWSYGFGTVHTCSTHVP